MHTREISVGRQRISIETGRLAKQADGSVVVRSGDTMVLVTACTAASPREGIDFLPLTVNYTENAQGDIDRVWILTDSEASHPQPASTNSPSQ